MTVLFALNNYLYKTPSGLHGIHCIIAFIVTQTYHMKNVMKNYWTLFRLFSAVYFEHKKNGPISWDGVESKNIAGQCSGMKHKIKWKHCLQTHIEELYDTIDCIGMKWVSSYAQINHASLLAILFQVFYVSI